jgi:hypothetical protein
MKPTITTPSPATAQILGDSHEKNKATQECNGIADKMKALRQQMKMGAFGRTAHAILGSIPQRLANELSCDQLVLVADALHEAHQSGKAKAEEEILREGAIYSPVADRMLEIMG